MEKEEFPQDERKMEYHVNDAELKRDEIIKFA